MERINRMKIVYVAGPYRAKTPWKVARNIFNARILGLQVAKLGVMPLIPHANTAFYDGEMPDSFWLAGTLEMMSRCDAIMLLKGWEKSSGTRAEVELAKKLGIQVFDDLKDLKAWVNSLPGIEVRNEK